MRNTLIDALKGVAIPLVIFGHYVPASSPAYWVWFSGAFIDGFYMDVFFLISGYLFVVRPVPVSFEESAAFIGKKAKRLMAPFFFIALLYLILKVPTQTLLSMHTPVTFESLYFVFANPERSYAPILWFLEALFLIFAVFVLLHQIVRNRNLLACVLLAAPLLAPALDVRILQLVCLHLPAFCLGVLLSGFDFPEARKTWQALWAATALFAVTIVIFQFGPAFLGPYIRPARALAVSFFTLACLQFLPKKCAELLGILGLYASSIYLLHFPFESLVKKIAEQVFHAPQSAFWLFAVPAFVVAIVVPILLEQMILQKHPKLLMCLLGETPSDKGARLRKAFGLSPAVERCVGAA